MILAIAPSAQSNRIPSSNRITVGSLRNMNAVTMLASFARRFKVVTWLGVALSFRRTQVNCTER